MTIAELEKKFLSRCLDFTEGDRVAEMCFAASKKCTRLVRG